MIVIVKRYKSLLFEGKIVSDVLFKNDAVPEVSCRVRCNVLELPQSFTLQVVGLQEGTQAVEQIFIQQTKVYETTGFFDGIKEIKCNQVGAVVVVSLIDKSLKQRGFFTTQQVRGRFVKTARQPVSAFFGPQIKYNAVLFCDFELNVNDRVQADNELYQVVSVSSTSRFGRQTFKGLLQRV